MLNLLPKLFQVIRSTPTKISRFYFFEWNFNFKCCNATYNVCPMLEKYIIIFFINIFLVELYICDIFYVKCFQPTKITIENFNVFFNIEHHVPLVNFELKIQI